MKLSLRRVLTLFAILPLAVGMVVAVIVASMDVRNSVEEQTKNTLMTACQGLNKYYEWDLQEADELNYETDYVDAFQEEEIDLTVFWGPTRKMTSIKKADGSRIEGTDASEAVINACLKGGQDYYSDDVKINDVPYYVYYKPMRNGDGEIVGMAFAGKKCEVVNAAVRGVVTKLVIAAVIFVILFGAVAIVLSRIISKPIEDVAKSIGKIADGDLNADVSAKARIFETKQLIESAKTLVITLSDIIGKTKSISDALQRDSSQVSSLSSTSSDGANQIANAMEDLAQGATGMAETVQNINEQVVEMGIAIEGISENAVELSQSSGNIQSANKDATEYISKVSSSSGRCVEAVEAIKRQIEETNEAVDKIKDAVEMISSITSQTNLLALNASIEAARAGEAGRGFTVVATEIGSLSDQSDKSAKEIKVIVDQIIEKSSRSVELSQEVSKIISDEQEYIDETQNKFEVLNKEIATSVDEIDAISKKIKSLESVKNVIISSVQDFSAITEENAASNEEVSASVTGIVEAISEIAKSSGDTNIRAQELDSTVSFFR